MKSKQGEIYPGIRIVDLALVYKDTLIIGDLQLGFEEALERRGVLLPRFQLKDIIERLDKILSGVKVKRLVVNGDIKHEFGTITDQEWRDALKFFDYVFEKLGEGGELVLVKGNHDMVLDPIAKKRNIKVVEAYQCDDITIVHGHKITLIPGKVVVIGHEHPAVSFSERREEKFRCFLKGQWKDKVLIVQPSFNMLTAGSDILRENHLSPFLKDDIENFEVFVVEDKVRFFGRIKDIRKL